jgi:hypothetical protein
LTSVLTIQSYLSNCHCSNFSRYVDLFQEISPRIAKQLRFQVKLHHIRRRTIWREIWKWSCLPSLLYCISRKTVDTEYTYYSWCMTSTDIVKWRKNEWLWKWMRSEYFSRDVLAENINRWKNITADGLFRENGTTTIWIWKHWNNLMINNCSKRNSNWEIDDWMDDVVWSRNEAASLFSAKFLGKDRRTDWNSNMGN